MRIFTKEILKRDRLVSLCKNAIVSSKAETIDDLFFYFLCNREYKGFLEEKIETTLKAIAQKSSRGTNRINTKDVAQKKFANHIKEVKEIIKLLPKRISNEIADIRVFALGVVSKNVKLMLIEYANKTESKILDLLKIVSENNIKNQKKLSKEILINELCEILVTGVYYKNGNIDIHYSNKILRIHSAEIIEKDFNRINVLYFDKQYSGLCYVVQVELYYENGKFELHLLLEDRDMYNKLSLCYLTVRGTDITII